MKNNAYVLLWFIPVIFLLTLFYVTPSNSVSLDNIFKNEETSYLNTQAFFEAINVEAQAVIVKDLNTGDILYQKNAELPLPLASLTKIMTAIVIREYAKNVDGVFISRNAMRPEDGEDLHIGETFALSRLIDYMMIASSNDGAAAIALAVQNISDETSFPQKMNKVARKIGMKETNFLNETGLDENETQAGAYGSANDVVTMLEYALANHSDIVDATKESTLTTYSAKGYPHTVSNTNTIVSDLPNVIASKTGYTELAGGNLAVVIDPGLNRPVAIVVLGSSFDGRFSDVKALSAGVSNYFSQIE